MSVGRFALAHRSAILLATLLLVIGGVFALIALPAGIYPEVVFPRIVVLAKAGTFEPREMVISVTRPIEASLAGIPDLRRIRSSTVRGGSALNLDFRPGSDMPFALQQVQARLAAVQGQLPPGLDLSAERVTPSVFPVLQFELTGADPLTLRELAEYVVRPQWARLPDAGQIQVQGGLVREIAIVLDPAQLVARGISLPEITQAVRSGNMVDAVGRVDRDYQQRGVLIAAAATGPEAIADLPVKQAGAATVRVGDLGVVRYGGADRVELAAGNGRPAALINVSRQAGGNLLALERAVLASADSLQVLLPRGVKLEPVYNQGALVRAALISVGEAMAIGATLSTLVLLVFLRRPGLSLLAALVVPLTVLTTFGGLALAGDSLNLMSLGGLAVAIGLIIDDAVVVVENIQRRLAPAAADQRTAAIADAMDEIVSPVAGSTFTTIVVFAPLSLVDGAVGQFFRSFSIALSIAVVVSFLLAVFLLPALIARLPARSVPLDGESAREVRLQRWYRERITQALRYPAWCGVAAVMLAGGAVGSWYMVGTGFLPEMDEGGFVLDYWTPTGTSLTETDRQLHALEQILHGDSAVAAFTRRTGAELGLFASAPNTGDLTVLLKPRRERSASVYQVMERLRERIEHELPAVRVEFIQVLQDLLGDLTGAPSPIEVKLFHTDPRIAQAAARQVAATIGDIPGLVDQFDGVTPDLPTIQIRLDRSRVSRLGLTPAAVSEQARGSLFGADAGVVRDADRLLPVTVRVGDSTRFTEEAMHSLPIIAPAGWAPLGALGLVRDSSDLSELERENQRPMVGVTGAVDPEVSSLGAIDRTIRARLQGVRLPAGVSLEMGGQVASQQHAFGQLLSVLGLALGAVLLVLVIQFGSLRASLVILVAACLAVTGALGSLAITGVPFNVSSFMGVILLTGLVVKNGIILFDAAQRKVRGGLTPGEALLAAAALRARPILLTTLCTLGGLVPLALGMGAAAELQRPLAVAVIGGLSLSTAITLFLLPTALAWVKVLEVPR